jgi:predicted alpha/beta superfamily hydrolase
MGHTVPSRNDVRYDGTSCGRARSRLHHTIRRLQTALPSGMLPLLLFFAPPLPAQTRLLKVPSQILDETKIVHVQLPRDYGVAKQAYPVVVLLDGQVRAFFDLTVAAADYDLTGELHPVAMPRQIVIAIEHGSRAADLGTNAENFLRFLTMELLPRIDREYRTLPFRTLIGHSRGGAFALMAMCRAPRTFPAVIAISPSIADSLFSDVTRCVVSDSIATQRQLVLSAGTLEPRALTNTERLLRTLREKPLVNWRLHQVDATGFEHTGTPLVTIPLGLRFIFDDEGWDLPQPYRDSLAKREGDPERVLDAGLASLSRRFGFAVPASARQLSAVVQTWLARGDVPRAVASANRLVARYPEEMLSHTLLADASDLAGDRDGGRRAIQAALDMSYRIVWFDETQRTRFQGEMRRLLETRGR